MKAQAALAILMLAGAWEAAAQPAPPCPPRPAQLFIAPMGEPFRAVGDKASSMAVWFAGADADKDGRLTAAEMAADADRFFTALDLNGNGEIAPDEIAHYENKIAPEIRLYQGSGWPGDGRRRDKADAKEARRAARKGADYAAEQGAGRFAWLNIPEPVASADSDMNRGVSRAEFRTAALARFARIDKANAKVMTLAGLPPLPGTAPPCPVPGGKRPRR